MRDKTVGARYTGGGEADKGDMAYYNLPFPREDLQRFKALCAIRGETIRDAIRRLVAEEVQVAVSKGVLVGK